MSWGSPMLESSEESSSVPEPPPGSRKSLLTRAVGGRGTAMLQRIGWLRPSAAERRLWLVEGLVVLVAVSLVGVLMFLLLR
ncbi:MAG: hypothetical protein ACE5MH_02355 [Terriglobia bacterium]